MCVALIMEKMIRFSGGNIHDTDHLIRVWAYAKTIGEREGLDPGTRTVLEAAAITHDIACPYCRERYGRTDAALQEKEGARMARDFLAGTGLTEAQIERAVFLVGHHHTLTGIDGPDWQILVEADYIANASEKGYAPENVRRFMDEVMRTGTGRRIAASVLGAGEGPWS